MSEEGFEIFESPTRVDPGFGMLYHGLSTWNRTRIGSQLLRARSAAHLNYYI